MEFYYFYCINNNSMAYRIFLYKNKKKLLKNNDDRIKATSSILQSIKVIKMFTFESLFYNTLKKKRK